MAGMSDGKTDNWKRISRLVNTRQDGPCDERPSTRSNPQQLTTNHMSEHILKASIWYTGRQNWSSHGVIHASGSERHWRWKQGSKHQLPFDQSVAKDAQSRHTNLAMTWIDYKKAYNSMPYSWTLECLRLYKIEPCLVTFIRQLMAHWRTTLSANSKNITDATIKCGIYRGGALSLLLLNALQDKSTYKYRLKSSTTHYQSPSLLKRHKAICQKWAGHRLINTSHSSA